MSSGSRTAATVVVDAVPAKAGLSSASTSVGLTARAVSSSLIPRRSRPASARTAACSGLRTTVWAPHRKWALFEPRLASAREE